MRLASFTDYSLRVLIYLASKRDERSTVSEIADKYQISKNHLVKVVHNLSTMKLIDSFKGKGGGILLSVPPEKINVGKLIKKLENDSSLVECFGENGNCILNPTCKLKFALREAQDQFYETLEAYTLADIVTKSLINILSTEH